MSDVAASAAPTNRESLQAARGGALLAGAGRLWLPAILTLSVAVRVAASVWLGDQVVVLPGTADQVSYHALALRVLEGHGFSFAQAWWPATAAGAPTAHWSFLYTLYLAAVYTVFGPHPLVARLIQAAVVGLVQPYLAYRLGRDVFGGTGGLIAAGLTAVYAYFVYYTATLMTEPFFITLVLASLWLAVRWTGLRRDGSEAPQDMRRAVALSVGLGLALAGAVLLRQVFLLFVPLLLAWVAITGPRRQWGLILASGAIVAAALLPFSAYNYARFHRFVLLNTNAGFAFYFANHPIYGTHFQPILPASMGSYQSLIPTELRTLDEAALDQALLRRGLQFVLDDPARYLQLSLSRMPVLFMFWPVRESSGLSNLARAGSFGLLAPFMLYGLVHSCWPRPGASCATTRIALLVLFVGVYTGLHLLSWALIRYRLPVDAVLLVFAGFGLADLSGRLASLYRRVGHALWPASS